MDKSVEHMSPLREIILFSPAAGKCEQSLLVLMTLIFIMSLISSMIYATRTILHLQSLDSTKF